MAVIAVTHPTHYLRQSGEPFVDYWIRLFEHKNDYGLTCESIAALLNAEQGSDYTESKWRKDYAMFRVGEKRSDEEDERNAKEARRRILRFGDEVRHGQRHSKEHCDEIILDITDYEHYCATHPDFKNQKAQSTIKLLVKEYERCLAENDFLE